MDNEEENNIDNWTCGCLYKCNDCIMIEEKGLDKKDYFEKKDLDDY